MLSSKSCSIWRGLADAPLQGCHQPGAFRLGLCRQRVDQSYSSPLCDASLLVDPLRRGVAVRHVSGFGSVCRKMGSTVTIGACR
jgi:hypothetical protein